MPSSALSFPPGTASWEAGTHALPSAAENWQQPSSVTFPALVETKPQTS